MFKLINKMKNKKGFTLVELIIVLAVLVIIAAIAVPRFAKVQEESKVKADVSTAKSLAKATEMAMANDVVSLSDTVNISTDLVGNGYLDAVPTPQYTTSGDAFEVITTADGLVEVYYEDGGSRKEKVYPQ